VFTPIKQRLMMPRASWQAILGPKKKPQIPLILWGFYEFGIGFYRWDLSNALKVRTLKAIPMPSETKNMAALDWVWPAGKIR